MITMRFEKPINEMASNQAPEITDAVTLARLTNCNNDRIFKKMTDLLFSV